MTDCMNPWIELHHLRHPNELDRSKLTEMTVG